MLDDPWIQANSPMEPENIHALGAISVHWNICTTSLFLLFVQIVRLDVSVAKALVHEMSEAALADRIKDLLEVRPKLIFTPDGLGIQRDAENEIRHCLNVFNANRINRNTLHHYLPAMGRDGMEFWSTKGPEFKPKPIPNSLADLRRVSDEMRELSVYMAALGYFVLWLRGGAPPPAPLPDKPRIPKRLWVRPQTGMPHRAEVGPSSKPRT